MKKLYIRIIDKLINENNFKLINENNFKLINDSSNDKVEIIMNINKLDNYEILSLILKIKNVLNIYDKISKINIIFDIDQKNDINKILTKLNDILYKYNSKTEKIKIYNASNNSINLMNELFIYKDIAMDPNKTPDTYLKYILSRIPKYYKYKLYNINKNQDLFPLTRAVGLGSNYNSYFIHIYPKKIINNKKTIYLIGKSITYDTGGLNLKSRGMEEMKIDMIGSGILISLINLINSNSTNNIHLLIPIVENMISPNAIKPGSVVKTYNGKTIEIINTDAEGRLCIVDALNYCQNKLKKVNDCLIIDIATLTGNAEQISSNMSSICTSNDLGYHYITKLITSGELIGEYVDYLKIRKDYIKILSSEVADIKSINISNKADCILAGVFLNYFVDEKIPWIHIDLGSCVFINERVLSYGINLLYDFLNNIK